MTALGGEARVLRPALAPVAAIAASVVAGVGVARGGQLPLLAVAALTGLALFVTLGNLQFTGLALWIVLGALAYPFVNYPAGRPLLTFDRIWIVALAGVFIFQHGRYPIARASRFFLVAFVWFVISVGLRSLTTTGPSAGLGLFKLWFDSLVLPLVLFLVTRRLVRTPERVNKLAGAMAAAGVAVAMIGIGERLLGFELASRSGGVPIHDAAIGAFRVSGPYAYPEVFALVLAITLAATLMWMQADWSGRMLIGVALAAIQAAGLALAFFRAGWIAGVLVVLAGFGLRPGRAGRLLFVTAIVLSLSAVAFVQLSQNRTFSTRVRGQRATDNVFSRVATYKQGLEIFAGAPVFGVGVDEYRYAASARRPTKVHNAESLPFPHSSFNAVLAEQGVVGFLPLLAVVLGIASMLRSLKRLARLRADILLAAAAVGAVLAYLMMSLTLTMLPSGPSNAFLVLMLGAVAGRLDTLELGAEPSG